MRIKRVVSAFAIAASAAIAVGVGAPSALAGGLVAPVTAGPPKPPHLAHLELNGFFPSTTVIRVGDSVRCSINGFHTVSFLAKGQAPPPLIIPAAGNPISGKLDAAGASFWFNGQPSQIINPSVAAPAGGTTYAGSGYLNSGVPSPTGPPAPFVIKFTKAGTFTFHCLVHPGMKGVVKVLPKGKPVPTAAQDRAAANAQAAAAIVQARRLAKVKPPTATVLAGNDGAGPVAWLRFFPENLKIKAGTTVDFRIASKREVHTITFGPPAYTTEIENTFTTPQPNPAGPPNLLINPLASYPSDPPPLPAYTGANHGNGFEGAGILALGGPLPSNVKITFTKAGVYHFECVIHNNMDGTITVTP
jgi:plastocyanin